jgi:hypothetical protein
MINVVPTGARGLSRRSTVLGGAGLAVLGVTSAVAYAAWSVSATGSSQATSGTPTVGVVAVATPTASLYPGGSTPVYFTVTNPNSFPVTYNAITFGTVTVAGDQTTCDPATYIITSPPSVSIPLAANTTSTVQTPAGAITLSTSAPDTCQGRTFTVATSLSGVSG